MYKGEWKRKYEYKKVTLEKGNLNRREETEMGKTKTWRERKDERKEKLWNSGEEKRRQNDK